MIIDVRGGLGMQVMELFAGFAKALETKQKVEEIHINIGGHHTNESSKTDHLSKLFDLKIPVHVTGGMEKQRVWTEENLKRILKYRKKIIRNHIRLKSDIPFEKHSVVVNVRGSDRQATSTKLYKEVVDCLPNYFISGDSKQLIDEVSPFDHLKSKQDLYGDWLTVLNAKTVYCSFTSFVISTILLNPNKDIFMFRKDPSAPTTVEDGYYSLVNMLFEKLDCGVFI